MQTKFEDMLDTQENPNSRRGPQKRTTEEIREAIIDEHLNQNLSIKLICQRHLLSDSTVREIIRRFKNEKRTAYKPRGGARAAKIGPDHANRIIELTDAEDENNILSLEQIREQLKLSFPEDFRIESSPISCHSISRHLNENALISIKRTSHPPSSPLPLSTTTTNTSTAITDPSTIATLTTTATGTELTSSLQALQEPLTSVLQTAGQRLSECKEYASTLNSMGASYLENCVFVGQTTYNAYMLPGSSRSKKGKADQPLKKAKRAVEFIAISAITAADGVLLLQTKMEKAGSEEATIMDFMKELIALLDQKYNDTRNIIMNDATVFNRSTAAITDLILHSKHKRIFLPCSLPLLDPTEEFFSRLPAFVNRQALAENERLLDRVAAAKFTIPRENCEAWIKNCINLLEQSSALEQEQQQ